MAKLSNSILEAAINGFEAQKRAIDVQIADLRAMMRGETAASPEAEFGSRRKRRKFSAAARQRMREAQRLRWAKARGASAGSTQQSSGKTAKPKRRLSPEGRKAISAAMKKRWAARKAAAAA